MCYRSFIRYYGYCKCWKSIVAMIIAYDSLSINWNQLNVVDGWYIVLNSFNCYWLFFHSVTIDRQFPTNNRRQDFQFDEYHNRQMIPYDANIPRPTGSHFFHYLRLIWSEQDSMIEYTLRYNTTRRGFWISSAPQKGSWLSETLTNHPKPLDYPDQNSQFGNSRLTNPYHLNSFCFFFK